MNLLALYHAQLAMPAQGEDRAQDFNRKLPGLAERARPANLANRSGCWFEFGPVKVHLSVDARFVAGGMAHPAFIAEDVRELQSKHEGACCRKSLEGYDRLSVYDPFANCIELMQPLTA